MRQFLLALLLVDLIPALVWAQVDPALLNLAKKEGEVVFYSSSATVDVQFMVDSFKKKYPFIKTTYYRSGDDSLINRVRTEANSGRLPARKDVALPSEELLQGVEPYPSQVQLAERFNDYVKLYHKLLQVP